MAEKDVTEKRLESYNDVFADILNGLLFDGEEEVTADTLALATPRTVYKADGKIREQERDTSKYWNDANIHIAMFGLENETTPEKDMPLRIIGYDGAAYRNQIFYVKSDNQKRKMNTNPRYPVVTLVLYFGYEKHWNQPRTLCGALDCTPKKLEKYISDYKINVFEIAWLTEEQVTRFKSDFRIVADYFVQMRKNGDYIPNNTQITHVREMLELMSALTGDSRFEEACNDNEEGDEVQTMCEVLDKIENRGIRKGWERGLQEGRIFEYIDLRREDGYPDVEITAGLVKKFALTAEQASKYISRE